MEPQWNPQTAVAALEKARDYCTEYPGLLACFAIGLVALDDQTARSYASILELSPYLFFGLPHGIDEVLFRKTIHFAVSLEKYLAAYRVHISNIVDLEAAIKKVRQLGA